MTFHAIDTMIVKSAAIIFRRCTFVHAEDGVEREMSQWRPAAAEDAAAAPAAAAAAAEELLDGTDSTTGSCTFCTTGACTFCTTGVCSSTFLTKTGGGGGE